MRFFDNKTVAKRMSMCCIFHFSDTIYNVTSGTVEKLEE